MKTYTINDIRDLDPCYDPSEYLAESWTGTVVDVLRLSAVPPDDRIWAATRLLDDDKTRRLFAVWCARDALSRVENPDPRSIDACDVAERYANGNATDRDLLSAWNAANAAWSDAIAITWSVAQSASQLDQVNANAVAWTAAAAANATDYASWSFRSFAYDTARSAALAAYSAAAYDAVQNATSERFAEHLVKMVENSDYVA